MARNRLPLFRYIAGAAATAALLFLAAGRLDYWQGWIFFLLNLGVVALTWHFLRGNPGLVAERFRPGKGMMWWDKGYLLIATPLNIGAIVTAGVDAGRRHWSRPPGALLYIGAIVIYIAGQSLFLWAKKVNPFFSSVARIQADRGQAVCGQGPYRFCRHPGYLGGLLFCLSTPIVLGSFWALVPQGLAALALLARTLLEDSMLTKDLLWYAEYKRAVPSLLVPGLF